MQRKDLEKLSREELVAKAEEHGVTRPRTLTMPELVDEILLATERQTGQKKSRGWFGKARDLLTSVIDRGLTTDPSKRPAPRTLPVAPPPLPTVTLAEIYAAQGHFERAIATLDEVVARNPSHTEAKRLRNRFTEQLSRARPSSPPPASRTEPPSPPAGSAQDERPVAVPLLPLCPRLRSQHSTTLHPIPRSYELPKCSQSTTIRTRSSPSPSTLTRSTHIGRFDRRRSHLSASSIPKAP